MSEFLTRLLQAVLIAAVPVCVGYIAKGIKAAAVYFTTKAESDIEKKYISAIADAVTTAVTYTSQTYVDKLKETNSFTKQNQVEALNLALIKARTLLTMEAEEFITDAYGDLSEYLKSQIEAEVRNQKLGIITLKA